jgi:formylglycine-generating enzyme required for sulfatase activity
MRVVLVAAAGLLLLSCAPDAPPPLLDRPSWAQVAPEQIEEAKKHGVPVAFENDLGMRFVLIPAGTFLMGSPEDEQGRDEDEALHEVRISAPFYLQTTEVTNAHFDRIMTGHASGRHLDGPDQPVVNVSWDDAVEYAKALSARSGERRYRLPTEAEWEHACRAGTSTPFCHGASIRTDLANFDGRVPYRSGEEGTFRGRTTAVGTLGRSAWALFDMHGNVFEWCADAYVADRRGERTEPPMRSDAPEYARVIRGGAWASAGSALRAANRDWYAPDEGDRYIGFRLVSPLPAKEP